MANSRISKAFDIPASEWRRIGEDMVVSIIVRSGAGVDRDGKAFPAYSARYVDRKAAGFKRKRTKTKGGPLKGVATSRRTATPDFRLTGETLNGTRVLASSQNGFVVGWAGGGGLKVAVNEERGKFKVGGYSPQELKRITDEVDKILARLWSSEPGQIDL